MTISTARLKDIPDLAQLAWELWPESDLQELKEDFRNMLDSDRDLLLIAYSQQGQAIGFIHVSIRMDYVEGSPDPPTGYVEGIYVRAPFRKQQVGRQLLQKGEDWARENACRKIASDAEIGNLVSQQFHQRVGFREVNQIMCFIKPL